MNARGGHELEHSYRYCARVAREQARNFYYSFLVLPREKRRAFCAVYAFLRHSDDISDDPASIYDAGAPGANDCAERQRLLAAWRGRLQAALDGDYGDSPLLPAFHDTIRRYRIPPDYFFELIEGAAMDLTGARFRVFPDLYLYCYRVAGVVGLISLHIFGFPAGERDSACRMAEACGVAFQLTNILRDLREDATRGRIYIPDEDLERFGYSGDDLRAGRNGDSFLRLMRFESERARAYYRQALPLLDLVAPDSRPALWAMIALYGGILLRMETTGFPMLRRRVELSEMEKVQILARAWSIRLRPAAYSSLPALPLS